MEVTKSARRQRGAKLAKRSGERERRVKFRPLFPALNASAAQALERLPEFLEEVWPLKRTHRAELAQDIRELSRLLTQERCALSHSYWDKPGFVSAYLYYFLPWNLIRQCRLYQGLRILCGKSGDEGEEGALVVDAGSGCLASPIALWLARPDLRNLPLEFLCFDRTRRPLELGKKLFIAVARSFSTRIWTIATEKCSLENAAKVLQKRRLPVRLFIAANMLNEFMAACDGGGKRRFRSAEFLTEEEAADEGLEFFLDAVAPFIDSGAKLLLIEPGTRLGGATLMDLRALALERNYFAHAPCTHQNACPLLRRDDKSRAHSSLGCAWCHFTFAAEGAPRWLKELSEEAGLDKKSLSLSLLLLSGEKPAPLFGKDDLALRILSHAFPVPGLSRHCRYGCEKRGLALLPDSSYLPQGASLPVSWPADPERDKKSGAVIIQP